MPPLFHLTLAKGRVRITGMQFVAMTIVSAAGIASRVKVRQWRMA